MKQNCFLFNINRRDAVTLIIFAVIVGVFYQFKYEIGIFIISLSFAAFLLLTKRCELSFCIIFLSVSFLDDPSYKTICLFTVLFAGMAIRRVRISKGTMIVVGLIILVLIISNLLGYEPSITKLISAIICVLMYIAIRSCYDNKVYGLLVYTMILIPIIMIIITIIKIATGQNYLLSQRLSFDDNHVRVLANACLFPSLYLIPCLFSGKRLYKNSSILLNIVLLSIYTLTMILSASRGVLASFLICIILSFMLSGPSIKKPLKTGILILLIAIFYFVFVNNTIFNLDRIFVDNRGGMNGRNVIWTYYINRLLHAGPLRVLFGFGSGNITRISFGTIYSNAYSHSTYLDILFSHGIIGFLIISCVIIYIFTAIIKSKSRVLIPVFIGLIVCFIPHGVVYNPELYINLAILYGLTSEAPMTEFYNDHTDIINQQDY